MSYMTAETDVGSSGPIPPVQIEVLKVWLSSLLTTADLMRIFGRSELTISQWVQRDNLPCIRIKGDQRDTIRYDKNEVLAWARSKGKRIRLVA